MKSSLMTRKLLPQLILYNIAIILSACTTSSPKVNTNDSFREAVFETDRRGNKERKTLVDSLRWLMYAMNYENYVVNEKNKYEQLNVLSFELRLVGIDKIGVDTAKYIFFPEKDSSERYIIVPADFVGIEMVKEQPFLPFAWHFSYDHPANNKFFRGFFQRIDSSFMAYLDNYRGEMNEWLRSEYQKRKRQMIIKGATDRLFHKSP